MNIPGGIVWSNIGEIWPGQPCWTEEKVSGGAGGAGACLLFSQNFKETKYFPLSRISGAPIAG